MVHGNVVNGSVIVTEIACIVTQDKSYNLNANEVQQLL